MNELSTSSKDRFTYSSVVPSPAVLAAHGLTELEIDSPPSSTAPTPLSAHALFRPVPAFPALSPIDPANGERVRLRWTSLTDIENATNFRRTAQIIALDCCRSTTAFTLSKTQSHDAQGSESVIHSSDYFQSTLDDQLKPPHRAGTDKEILAWWEDEIGLWLVTREDRLEDFVTLTQYWDNLYDTDDGDEDVDVAIVEDAKYMVKAIVVLAQLAYCLRVSWVCVWMRLTRSRFTIKGTP